MSIESAKSKLLSIANKQNVAPIVESEQLFDEPDLPARDSEFPIRAAFYEHGKNSHAFKCWRNKVNCAVKQARKTYYSHLIDKLKNTNPTGWLKEIKAIGSLSSQASWHSQLLSETIPTCGHLAEYYNDCLVGLTSHFNSIQDKNPRINASVPSNLLVSTSSVLVALQRLNNPSLADRFDSK